MVESDKSCPLASLILKLNDPPTEPDIPLINELRFVPYVKEVTDVTEMVVALFAITISAVAFDCA
jgi:hypothetical protein